MALLYGDPIQYGLDALNAQPAETTVGPERLTAKTDLQTARQALGKSIPVVIGTGRVDGIYFIGGVVQIDTTTTTTTWSREHITTIGGGIYGDQVLAGGFGGFDPYVIYTGVDSSVTTTETFTKAGYLLAYDPFERGYDLIRLDIEDKCVFDSEHGIAATETFRFYGGRQTGIDPILSEIIGENAGAYQNFVLLFLDGYPADRAPSISAVISNGTNDDEELIPVDWEEDDGVPSWDNELWTGEGFSLMATVQCDFAHGGEGTCAGPYMETYNGALHANRFIDTTRLFTIFAPDGPGYYVTNGTVTVGPCTASGFEHDSGDVSLGAWAYCETEGLGGPEITFTPAGTDITLQVSSIESLDGTPVCRSIAAGGWTSCARTGGASSVAGASISLAGATLTEVGGEGRVFSVVAITGGPQPASIAGFGLVFQVT